MKMRIKPMVFGLLAAASTAAVVTPARADHHGSITIVSDDWGCRGNERISRRPTRSYADCEFDRGSEYGSARGFDAGYLDAVHGRCYCAQSGAPLCRVSSFFRDGYLRAFSKSYAAGFEKGRCEQVRSTSRGCR